MKKSILILAAIIISLIGVNAQQSETEQIKDIETIELDQQDLYESLINDFDNWYKNNTYAEDIEDNINQYLYHEISEDLELFHIVESTIIFDRNNDRLYRSLKEDLIIYDVLSIAEIKF
eukprot:Anaeramoba_ignava/a220297_2.p1 GENE.a220297_2~~a220297_2.p1  ORF type:complete len:119 (+),score=16.76 a220297_2:100-456(+)